MPYYDITEETLSELGLTLTGSNGALVPTSIRWDVSIGGLPFLMGISDQMPMRRETSEFRRQRIDQERNPGEQSLDSGYWIRSQSSWHYGFGLTTAEPLEVNEGEARFRYQTGGGVDVWEPGSLGLLHSTASAFSASAATQLMVGVDTGVLHAAGNVLTYIPTTGSASAVTWGGSATITSITSDGANYYVGTASGIYKGALPAGTGSKIWDTADTTIVRWVKSRLMATVGRAIYELTGTGPTLPTALDPGNARPSNWVWTDIAEGPSAIYLSGYAGDQSYVEAITVAATSSTVTLNQPTVQVDMPRSELVLSLYSYVGSYLIIGTNKGCRVASIDTTYGTLTLGPLLIESADGCRDAVAIDSYVYVTAGAKGEAGNRVQRAGLYRIDLGRRINQAPLQFASAPDLVAPSGSTGKAEQVTIAGGKLWFAVSGEGVYKETDNYVSEGWLETGRIRLGTVEPKSWQDVRLIGKLNMTGSVTAFVSTTGEGSPSSWTQSLTINGGNPDDVGTLGVVATTPQSQLYLAVRVTAPTTPTSSPTLIGYQIRAIPAPSRTELVSLPVMCFDFEVDRQGVRYGSLGGAYARFKLLKALEQATALVQFNDYTTGEQASAYIERVSYSRTNPPTRQVGGNGGIVTVLMRIVG